MSGTPRRDVANCPPIPTCQRGAGNSTEKPPPLPTCRPDIGFAGPHAVSCQPDALSVSRVPPTDTTAGDEPGKSTAFWFAYGSAVPSAYRAAQSYPPESPDAAKIVTPAAVSCSSDCSISGSCL